MSSLPAAQNAKLATHPESFRGLRRHIQQDFGHIIPEYFASLLFIVPRSGKSVNLLMSDAILNKPILMNARISLPLLLLSLILLTTACNRQQLDPKAVSNLCTNVTGAEAIYWDLRNGIARGDLPKGVPTLENPGGAYSHPNFPLLGFSYPAGWQTETLTDNNFGHTVGVNLIRNDNQAVWRSFSTSLNGIIPILDIVALEINNMLAFLGNPPIDEVVCTNNGVDNSLGNIIRQGESRLIRAGAFTIQVNVNVTYVDGLQSTFVSNQLTVAPTIENQALIADVFLPIDWQLLLKPEGDDLNRDSDNDGVWDVNDRFPNDPTKW